jgi:hypothetical protein
VEAPATAVLHPSRHARLTWGSKTLGGAADGAGGFPERAGILIATTAHHALIARSSERAIDPHFVSSHPLDGGVPIAVPVERFGTGHPLAPDASPCRRAVRAGFDQTALDLAIEEGEPRREDCLDDIERLRTAALARTEDRCRAGRTEPWVGGVARATWRHSIYPFGIEHARIVAGGATPGQQEQQSDLGPVCLHGRGEFVRAQFSPDCGHSMGPGVYPVDAA